MNDQSKFKLLNDMYVGKPDGEGPWDHELPDYRPMAVASKLNSLVAQYRKFGVNVTKVSASASVMASLMQSPNAKHDHDEKDRIVYESGDLDVNVDLNCKLKEGVIRIHAV